MANIKLLSKLDILAEVASQRFLENEKSRRQIEKVRALLRPSLNQSKNSKKSYSYEELSAMPAAQLVNRFSRNVHDEMAKKFSYSCLYLPTCRKTTESYGSEEKAFKDMKKHLKEHLEKAKNYPLSVTPPTLVEGNYSLETTASSRQESSVQRIVPESRRTIECDLKNFESTLSSSWIIHCEAFKKFKELENHLLHNQYEFRHRYMQFFVSISVFGCDHNYIDKAKIDALCSEFLKDLGIDFGLSVDPALLSNIEPPTESAVDQSDEDDPPNPPSIIVQPQFIITTPAVPYVHGTSCFDVVGIEEVNEDGTSVHPKRTTRPFLNECMIHPGFNKSIKQCCNNKKDITGKDRHPKSSRKRKVPGSVLGCVENQVNFKISKKRRGPRNRVIQDDSSENRENLQKIDEKYAFQLMAEARAQKTKEPFKCVICVDKLFMTLSALIHHYRSHAGLKIYTCDLCSEGFTRQSSLNYHGMIHKKIVRFTCEVCKRGFRHSSHYKNHVLSHTGKILYQCPDCGFSFKARNAYQRHLKLKHKKILTIKNEVNEL